MPYHDALDDALEFEVWVARGAKRGSLALADLVETYGQLATALNLDTAQPRLLGIASLTESLRRLPRGFEEAHKLVAVSSLAAFEQSPIDPDAMFASAWLDAQTLLVACPDGLSSLVALAMAFCALLHESEKYKRLRAQTASESENIALYALAAGISLDEWRAADALAGGKLDAHLTALKPPELVVHPNLHPSHHARRANAVAQRILSTLAETGLGSRPVHLWLGPCVLTDTLSPYARDLGPQLIRWAAGPQNSAPAVNVYDAATAFLVSDDRLQAEQQVAERSVGICRLKHDAVAFDIIDVARLDIAACDASIVQLHHAQASQGSKPIVLRLDATQADIAAPLVDHIARALGAQLLSVTLIAEGVWQQVKTVPIAAVRTHLPWHTGAPCSRAAAEVRHTMALAPIETFIDVPMPKYACPQTLITRLCASGHGVSFAQMPLVYSLTRNLGSRPEPGAHAQVQCFVVAQEGQSLATQAQLACARLNTLLGPVTVNPLAPKNASNSGKRSPIRLRV